MSESLHNISGYVMLKIIYTIQIYVLTIPNFNINTLYIVISTVQKHIAEISGEGSTDHEHFILALDLLRNSLIDFLNNLKKYKIKKDKTKIKSFIKDINTLKEYACIYE